MSARVTEEEILIATLKLLALRDSKTLTTSQLIEMLAIQFDPIGKDAEILDGRSDTYFSQKVRNLVSHRDGNNGIVTRGLVTYNNHKRPGTLTITPLGENYASKH